MQQRIPTRNLLRDENVEDRSISLCCPHHRHSGWSLFSVVHWRVHSVSAHYWGTSATHTQATRKGREARKMKKKKEEIISLLCSRFPLEWLAFQMLPSYSNWQMATTADGWAQLRHRYSCK